jgi:hypothetical protein
MTEEYKSLAASKITRMVYDEWISRGKQETVVRIPVDLTITRRYINHEITRIVAIFNLIEIVEIPEVLLPQVVSILPNNTYTAHLHYPCSTKGVTTIPRGIDFE